MQVSQGGTDKRHHRILSDIEQSILCLLVYKSVRAKMVLFCWGTASTIFIFKYWGRWKRRDKGLKV